MGENLRYARLKNRLRVKHLLVLAELGDVKNVRHAAVRLNMTQPAASKLLREAEEAFGTRLFERTRRGVVPNDAGSLMIRRARALLRELDGARDELDRLNDNLAGRVTVGAYAVAVPVLVPMTIIRLRKTHPRILVTVEEGTNASLLPGLRRGDFDCVIGRITEDIPSDLTRLSLYEEAVCVVCGTHHELLHSDNLEIERLAHFDWILPPENHPFRQRLEAQFTVAGLARPNVILESASTLANASFLQRTNALALLPAITAQYLTTWGAIGTLPLQFPASFAPVSILQRPDGEQSPATTLFIDAAKVVARQMNGEYQWGALQKQNAVIPD